MSVDSYTHTHTSDIILDPEVLYAPVDSHLSIIHSIYLKLNPYCNACLNTQSDVRQSMQCVFH